MRVGPLNNSNGDLVTDPKEMATLLNANYASVFTRDDGSAPPRLEKLVEDGMELKTVSFSKQKVMDKISKLRDDTAPGPDGVTPRILKAFHRQFCMLNP